MGKSRCKAEHRVAGCMQEMLKSVMGRVNSFYVLPYTCMDIFPLQVFMTFALTTEEIHVDTLTFTSKKACTICFYWSFNKCNYRYSKKPTQKRLIKTVLKCKIAYNFSYIINACTSMSISGCPFCESGKTAMRVMQ